MDMNFDVKKVMQERFAISMGLDKYQYIMKQVKVTNVSIDDVFQKTFNGFYRIRRNEKWRNTYYKLFEKEKKNVSNFTNIITRIYEETGNVEPSFSSKMLATIHENKPIWDVYVIQNLNMQLKGKSKEEKLQNAIKLYSDIEDRYTEFLKTDKAKECIEVFDLMLPDYKWISEIKKIDCILWSIR